MTEKSMKKILTQMFSEVIDEVVENSINLKTEGISSETVAQCRNAVAVKLMNTPIHDDEFLVYEKDVDLREALLKALDAFGGGFPKGTIDLILLNREETLAIIKHAKRRYYPPEGTKERNMEYVRELKRTDSPDYSVAAEVLVEFVSDFSMATVQQLVSHANENYKDSPMVKYYMREGMTEAEAVSTLLRSSYIDRYPCI